MLLRKRGESNILSNLDGWHWKYWMQCVTEIIFLNWNYLMNTKNKEIKSSTLSETQKNTQKKQTPFLLTFWQTARIQKTRGELLIYSLTWRAINLLTNKHAPANTSSTSGIFPDDLNNHFCSVASKVIKTDNSPINELTLLELPHRRAWRRKTLTQFVHRGPTAFSAIHGLWLAETACRSSSPRLIRDNGKMCHKTFIEIAISARHTPCLLLY